MGKYLTATLARDLRVLSGKLKRRLREQAHMGDLTGTQLSVLGRLEREGSATVTSLAKAEAMRPQSMGAIVAALESAGLVSGSPDPRDGRQTILSMTPGCRDLLKVHRAAREDWLFRALQTHLTPEEQHELAGALVLLNRILDSQPAETRAVHEKR
ncbi:MAG TPA: MarR family transcriptional regulator [Steroidobacteraceae bacterium]|nr:MarR family transcriptional regulator [Steroidobacteraceae bacterium]